MNNSYSSERNVQILIGLLKANKIRKIVASPGTTNIPFVMSLQNDGDFEIYSCVDERSAAYMAVGIAAESREYPEARRSGDVDFYVCRKDLENARTILQRKVSFSDDFSEQHWDFVGDGIMYEMHFRTAVFSLKQNQEYWDDLVENMMFEGDGYYVDIHGEPIPTFEPTINAAYLFIHIYHHFLKEGIGLRQFCDWMMFLRKHKEEIDYVRLNNILEHLEYVKAYKAFGTILVKYLGLKPEEFPYQLLSADYEWTDKILKVIANGGNFGKYGRSMKHPGILHSIETGFYSFSHICRFYKLSPKENIRLFPKLLIRSAKKYID